MTNNYQTKYLKYKLKYFNLLNQTGGYEEKEFEIILNNPNENGYLMEIDKDELLIDSISLSEIHKNNAVYIDTQIYDANSLSECIERYYLNNKILATNPLNRREYTEEDYNLIADHISGLDEKLINKRKEIINEIKNLIQLDKDIQEKILHLEPEQRKIFLNDHKFKIFIKFDYETKKKLIDNKNVLNKFIKIFNNYENTQIKLLLQFNKQFNKQFNDQTVLDNEIINDRTFIYLKIIKNNFITNILTKFKLLIKFIYQSYIEKNNEFLFFFPEEYMTDEIIKLHGTALEYVPKDKITFEICKIAVKDDGLALQYVPIDIIKDKEYFSICKLAVENKGNALKHVMADKIPDNDYEYICRIAVLQDGYALEYVVADKMENKEYFIICSQAVEQNGIALKHVMADNIARMTHKEYLKICKLAVQRNGFALKFVKFVIVDKITKDEYFNICRQAVDQNGIALYFVIVDKISEDEYFNICVLAVKEDSSALEHVKNDKMTLEEYLNICELAVNQDSLALKFVKNDKMTLEEYLNICELAVNQDSSALEHVKNDKMTKDQYLYISNLANKKI